MQEPNVIEFERLIRAYAAGEVPWDAVHNYAIEMEWRGATQFPIQLRQSMGALHAAFLTADEKDDPQFRLDQSEVLRLLRDLDEAQAKQGNT